MKVLPGRKIKIASINPEKSEKSWCERRGRRWLEEKKIKWVNNVIRKKSKVICIKKWAKRQGRRWSYLERTMYYYSRPNHSHSHAYVKSAVLAASDNACRQSGGIAVVKWRECPPNIRTGARTGRRVENTQKRESGERGEGGVEMEKVKKKVWLYLVEGWHGRWLFCTECLS